MDTQFPIASIASSLLVMLLAGAGFGAGATWLARRAGGLGLALLWLAASVLAAGLFVLRLSRLYAGQEIPATFRAPFPAFWLYFPLWALGFGAVTLYIARRRRRAQTQFSGGVAVRSAGLFLAGALLFLIGFAAADLSRLF